MINLYTLRTVSAFDLPSGYELYVTLKIKKNIYNSKKGRNKFDLHQF